MRQPWTPLEWTPPNSCSAFLLEDNTAVFIGTRKYETALRQDFLKKLLLSKGASSNNNGDTPRAVCADKDDTVMTSAILKRGSHDIALTSKSDLRHSTFDNISGEYSHVNDIEDIKLDIKQLEDPIYSSSDDSDLPEITITGKKKLEVEVRSKCQDEQSRLKPKVSIGVNDNETYSNSDTDFIAIDDEVTTCSNMTKTAHLTGISQLTGRDDGSSSSDDADLPQINITGKGGRTKWNEYQFETKKGTEENINSYSADIDSGITERVTSGKDGLIVTQNCPICNISFPTRYASSASVLLVFTCINHIEFHLHSRQREMYRVTTCSYHEQCTV